MRLSIAAIFALVVGFAAGVFWYQAVSGSLAGGRSAGSLRPGLASIQYETTPGSGFDHHCVGMFIGPDVILTAEHCVPVSTWPVWPRRAVADFDLNAARPNVFALNGKPVYWPIGLSYVDVAMVNATGGRSRGAVQLEAMGDADYKSLGSVLVTGWGATWTTPWSSTALEADLAVNTPFSSARAFVAGDGSRGPCHGDSGGPLLTGGLQIGVLVRGDACNSVKFPAVYTPVATIRDWICSCKPGTLSNENLAFCSGAAALSC